MGQDLSHLKTRHEYDRWRGVRKANDGLFVWRIHLSGNEIPRWTAIRIEAFPTRPPTQLSIWSRQEQPTVALRLDVDECESLHAAHEHLIERLAGFQSPGITMLQDGALGDVAFATPSGSTVLFSRANLVVMMTNADSEVISLIDLARAFDAWLAAPPDTGASPVVPVMEGFGLTAKELHVKAPAPIELKASDPIGRPVWHKLYASDGEFRVEQERLVFTATAAGAHTLEAYAINPNHGAAKSTIHVMAEQ
jgi:hypothetical protein